MSDLSVSGQSEHNLAWGSALASFEMRPGLPKLCHRRKREESTRPICIANQNGQSKIWRDVNKKAILSPKAHAVPLAVEPGGPPRSWASAGSDPPLASVPTQATGLSMPQLLPHFTPLETTLSRLSTVYFFFSLAVTVDNSGGAAQQILHGEGGVAERTNPCPGAISGLLLQGQCRC